MPDSSEQTRAEESGSLNTLAIELVSSILLEKVQAHKLIPNGLRYSKGYFERRGVLTKKAGLSDVHGRIKGSLSAYRPEALSNALRIQPCRTANERKILFILKKEEFGFAFIDIRTADPIRNGAVDNRQPELFIGTSLALKNKVAQSFLLRSSSGSRPHIRNVGRRTQWSVGTIGAGTRGLVLGVDRAYRLLPVFLRFSRCSSGHSVLKPFYGPHENLNPENAYSTEGTQKATHKTR